MRVRHAARPASRPSPPPVRHPAPSLVADKPVRTSSLRVRVAAWVLVLLLAVLVGLGFVVNVLLRQALSDDLRTRLQDRAGFAAVLREEGVTGQALADKTTGAGMLATFTAGDVHFVGRGGMERSPGGPPRGGHPPAARITPSISYTETGSELIAAVTLPSGILELRTSEFEINATMAHLLSIELAAGAATVLVTAALLYGAVGQALRPLHRVTALAARTRDGARGRRLRPTHPRTDLGRTATTIDEMLDALETAEAAAQRAELRMRQFLADASHDLRTPLAGVIAGSEQLLRSPTGRAEREERLVAVVRQARRAARLVDDLLLITRLDDPVAPDQSPRTVLDLSALVMAEVEAVHLRCPGLPVRLRSGAAPVTGDPDQLARATGNLLDNACRAGGPVTITVESVGHWVRLRVQDSGQGVSPADRERIFDRFVRLSSARSGPGSGLGLPIVRAIARAHGGEAHCVGPNEIHDLGPPGPTPQASAAPTRGAIFEMVLPAVQQLVVPPTGAPADRGHSADPAAHQAAEHPRQGVPAPVSG